MSTTVRTAALVKEVLAKVESGQLVASGDNWAQLMFWKGFIMTRKNTELIRLICKLLVGKIGEDCIKLLSRKDYKCRLSVRLAGRSPD